MKRILIIEDEPGVQMTLEDRLTAEGYEVVIKGDGPRGESEAMKGFFDLILLDIMLPGRDGYAICHNLRKAGIMIPILMLTARGTNLDTVLGLRQGADDYLAKPFDMGVLLARIEALLRRYERKPSRSVQNDDPVSFGPFLLDPEKGELFKNSLPVPLNAQEYRLLRYLVSHSDRIISREQLLDEVWGYDTETTSRTVDVHVAKIRRILGDSDNPKHLLTVRGRGYKFLLG